MLNQPFFYLTQKNIKKLPFPVLGGGGLARFTVLLVALFTPVPPAPVHILTVKVKSACEMPSVTVTIENEPVPPVAVYDPVTAEKLLSVVVPLLMTQYRVLFANEPVEVVSNVPELPFVMLEGTEVNVTNADGAIITPALHNATYLWLHSKQNQYLNEQL